MCARQNRLRLRVDHSWETRAHRMEREVIAWSRTQEPCRLDRSWYLQEAFEDDRPECPVVPGLRIQDDTSHHPVSTLHLHELPADLCQTRPTHRCHILDPGQ